MNSTGKPDGSPSSRHDRVLPSLRRIDGTFASALADELIRAGVKLVEMCRASRASRCMPRDDPSGTGVKRAAKCRVNRARWP